MSPHLLQALTNGKLINDYEVVQNAAPNPDGSHSGTAGIRLSSFSNAGEPGSNSTFNVGGSISSMSGEAAIAHVSSVNSLFSFPSHHHLILILAACCLFVLILLRADHLPAPW